MSVIRPGQRHILILPSWYFDKEAEGVFIHEHARMSAGQNLKVGILYVRQGNVFERSDITFHTSDHINIGVLQGYSLPKVFLAIGMWKRRYLKLYKQYSVKFGAPDILHAHGYIAGIAARYLSDQTGIPYLITEHASSIPEQSVPWYHHRALRLAYAHAVRLIAVSEFLKKAMTTWLSMPEAINVIGNPVDFSKFLVKETRNKTGVVQLISVGSLEKRKNYRLLLEALPSVRQEYEIRMTIVGTGPELEQLIHLAKALHIEDIVHFAGYLTSQDLITLIRKADFFVSSSDIENFGVAIVEALACGIPVIATRSGGVEEYLHHGIGRLSPVNDPSALSKAIKDAIAHRNDFNPSDIRNEVKQKFDFPVIGPQVTAVYNRILFSQSQ